MKKILVIGSINMDFIINVKHNPKVGETILADNMKLMPGGKGANQAFAAGKLGGDVAMLGAVGKDSYGEQLSASLQKAGVWTGDLKWNEDCSSAIALVYVNASGDNSIVVVPGANSTVDKAYIDEKKALIEACDIVIFQLEIPVETVLYAARAAHQLGKTVILDPAPAVPDLPEELFQYVDYIKPNETELGMLTGKAIEDCRESMAELKRRGVKNVIVTLGKEGCRYADENGEIGLVPGEKVQAVDTTGAGDCFTAAFAVGLARGDKMKDALIFATKAAAISTTRAGAQPSYPGVEEII